MKLLLGLGNIGKEYELNYHNVGFLVLDKVAKNLNIKFKTQDCLSDVGVINVKGEKIILAKPRTFVNETGKAVQSFLKKYKELDAAKDIIICYDDFDLKPGAVRIKEIGGPGTHNGIKSIYNCLNSKLFRRVRIGTGEKPEEMPIVDFVLSDIKKNSQVFDAIDYASEELTKLIKGEIEFDKLMLETNTKFNQI